MSIIPDRFPRTAMIRTSSPDMMLVINMGSDRPVIQMHDGTRVCFLVAPRMQGDPDDRETLDVPVIVHGRLHIISWTPEGVTDFVRW